MLTRDVALLYFFHTCENNSVFYSEICVGWNVNNPVEKTMLSAWQLCERYEYSVSHDHRCSPHRVTGWNEMGAWFNKLSLYMATIVNELADTWTETCTYWAIMTVPIVDMHKILHNIGLLLANSFASTHIILYILFLVSSRIMSVFHTFV